MRSKRIALGIFLLAVVVSFSCRIASAQTRAETLLVVTELGPNSMNIHGLGANRPAYQASWNVYDRLLNFGAKKLPDGTAMYDYKMLKPELAESWTVKADGKS